MIVEELERLIANEEYNIPHERVICVNSGTSALIASLSSINLDGGEVITTPFTFQATSDAIILAGGKPVFADIHPITHLIDIDDVCAKITNKTKAILPVHLFNRLVDIQTLKSKIPKHIMIIEDGCQSFLNPYYRFVGDILCHSFYRTKNLQCDQGGAIICNSYILSDKIRAICNNGRTSRFSHEYIGYNFQMSEHSALVAYNQLKYHRDEVVSGLGKYSETNGFYPKLVYQQPSYLKLGITGNCPIAESVAKEIYDRYQYNR